MKVKLTELYVIISMNDVDFYFDTSKVDDDGFLEFDGWGGNVEGKPHLLVKDEDQEEENA